MFVDSFPGDVCGGQPEEIDGVTLESLHRSYDTGLCVKRFLADDDMQSTSTRLMLKFERFYIIDRSVELKILGNVGREVR